MRERIACAAVVAVLFAFTSGAEAVAEAEPEEGAAASEAMTEGEAEASGPMTSGDAEASEAMQAGEAAAEGDAMAEEPPAAPSGRVSRSGFTSEVVDREPTDTLSSLTNDVEQVAYFTELRGFEGATVVHRWTYGGEVVAEVPFDVGGPRWRVHSTKRLDPSALGEWSVSVVADGEVLTTENLRYTDAPEGAPAATASEDAPGSTAPGDVPAPPASEDAPAPPASGAGPEDAGR